MSDIDGALTEAIGAYQSEDPASLDDTRLDAEVVALRAAKDRIDAEYLRRLGPWRDRGIWSRDGARSAGAALARECGITTGSARADLQLTSRLDEAPGVAAAFTAGALTRDKARALTNPLDSGATDTLRAAFADSEASLVDAATSLGADNVAWLARNWAAAADPEGHQATYNDRYRQRRVNLSTSFEGWGHLDAFLEPEAAEKIKAVLDAFSDRYHREDRHNRPPGEHPDEYRSAPQRRHDGLADAFAALHTDLGLDPDPGDPGTEPKTTGGPSTRRPARPTIGILCDLDRLTSGDGIAMLADSAIPLPQAALERHLCDCSVIRVVLQGPSQPLDIGRASRQPNTATIRALIIRDGGCAFAGCDMPTRWCDAHHIIPWEHGGPTALHNLVLLCRHHHRLVHDFAWTVALDPHTGAIFTAPEGTPTPADPTRLDLAIDAARIARSQRRRKPRPEDQAA